MVAPLKPEQIARVRELRGDRIPLRVVSQLTGISERAIREHTKGICPYQQSVAVLQPAEIELVRAYRICGFTLDETSRITGVGVTTIKHRARGIRPARKITERWDTPPVQDVYRWRLRVLAGETRESIAIDEDVCRQTVARYTRDIETPNRGGKPTYDQARIRALVAKNLTDKQIAARIGCSDALPWHYREERGRAVS